jgi:hypothetical protein
VEVEVGSEGRREDDGRRRLKLKGRRKGRKGE